MVFDRAGAALLSVGCAVGLTTGSGCAQDAELPCGLRDAQSYAFPVQMHTEPLNTSADEWPVLAGCARGDTAVVSPNGVLTVADQHGDVRFTHDGVERVVACSSEVVAVWTGDVIRRFELSGDVRGDSLAGMTNVAITTHPDGGFAVAYEDGGNTHVVRMGDDGALIPIAVLEGWTSAADRYRPIAVRRDGAVGMIIHEFPFYPPPLLGSTLVADAPEESGIPELFIAFTAEGQLIDALAFHSWEHLMELRADDVLQAMTHEIPQLSSIRSLKTDTTYDEVRRQAQFPSAMMYIGDSIEAYVVENQNPALSKGNQMFFIEPSDEGSWLDLTEWHGDYRIPFVDGGTCRGVYLAGERLHAVCVHPPVSVLAASSGIEDDDATAWGFAVLRSEIDL